MGDAAPAVVIKIESALPRREPTPLDCLDDRVPEILLQPHDASVLADRAAQRPQRRQRPASASTTPLTRQPCADVSKFLPNDSEVVSAEVVLRMLATDELQQWC